MWTSYERETHPCPKERSTHREQIFAILRRHERGEAAEAASRSVNISEETLYRWKQQYGAMKLDEVRKLKALRDGNARLKRLDVDQALNIGSVRQVSHI